MREGKPTNITHLLDNRNNPPKQCEPGADGSVPDGACVAYRENGALLLEMTYAQGVAHGAYRDFWPDGRIATEGQYAAGLQDGEWRFYHAPEQPPELVQFIAGQEFVDWDVFFG